MSASGGVGPVQAAVVEILGMADLYKRIQDSCWTKCIPHVKTATLDAGECSCLDRCVNKSVYEGTHAAPLRRCFHSVDSVSTFMFYGVAGHLAMYADVHSMVGKHLQEHVQSDSS